MRYLSVLTFLLFTLPVLADSAGVQIAVKLSPMGSFVAKSTALTGSATKTSTGVEAHDVQLDLRTLKTGIELRDKHTLKHLETDKYPFAILTVGKGQGAQGKGTGHLKLHGTEKDIEGTYKSLANGMIEAKFSISLKDFNITGIRYMGTGVKDEVEIIVRLPLRTTK